MEIKFRKAEAGDADMAIPLVYASGPDAFDYIFHDETKGSAQDFLRFAFVRQGGQFSYDNHLVVTADDRVAAIGTCFSGKNQWRFTLHVIMRILVFYGMFRGIGVMVRGLQFERIVRPPGRKQYAIEHLGVSKEYRGKGIGSRLIHQLIINARAPIPALFILDVSDSNPRAMALYERLGFKVTRHTGSSLERTMADGRKTAVPGHSRMELHISKKNR
jgi:ribosomal protein S18 acetylase RimI-like enzyme